MEQRVTFPRGVLASPGSSGVGIKLFYWSMGAFFQFHPCQSSRGAPLMMDPSGEIPSVYASTH